MNKNTEFFARFLFFFTSAFFLVLCLSPPSSELKLADFYIDEKTGVVHGYLLNSGEREINASRISFDVIGNVVEGEYKRYRLQDINPTHSDAALPKEKMEVVFESIPFKKRITVYGKNEAYLFLKVYIDGFQSDMVDFSGVELSKLYLKTQSGK